MDGGDADVGESRRWVFWALGVGVLVVVVLAGAVLVLAGPTGLKGSNRPNPDHVDWTKIAGPVPSAGVPGSSRSTAPSPATTAPSASPSSSPCVAACSLPGDGGVLLAINRLRAGQGEPPVTGHLTAAAQRCAASAGDAGSCPGTYFWEPVASKDGAAVVAKVQSRGGTVGSLLDAHITTVNIGWAFAGQWECAIIALA